MRFQILPVLIISIVFGAQQSSGQERAALGSKAPGFTLQDQHEKPKMLDELLKDSNVALVFHRSADW